MQAIGKSDSTGKGSFRITADGEVLTKVNAASYVHSDQAPHSDGWIAVYVGRLHGQLGFDKININPSPLTTEIKMWDGFPSTMASGGQSASITNSSGSDQGIASSLRLTIPN